MLIYCDSVILIYLLDSVGPFNVRAVARMAAMQAAGDVAAFSDLTRLECRVSRAVRSGSRNRDILATGHPLSIGEQPWQRPSALMKLRRS